MAQAIVEEERNSRSNVGAQKPTFRRRAQKKLILMVPRRLLQGGALPKFWRKGLVRKEALEKKRRFGGGGSRGTK